MFSEQKWYNNLGDIMKIFSILSKIIGISLMLILIVVFSALRSNSVFSEWYTTSFGNFYLPFIGNVMSAIPFSLYELLVFIFILIMLYSIIILIVKIVQFRWIKALNKALSTFSFIIFIALIYTVTGSIGYGRNELPLNLYQETISNDEIKMMAEYHLNRFNSIANQVTRNANNECINKYDRLELSKIINEEYHKLDSDYFINYDPTAKEVFSSWILSQMHITGIFFAPTAETNINKDIPTFDIPFTYAHEFAHAKGVAREDDANLIALYITLNSDDIYLQYSAYSRAFTSILYLVNFIDHDYYLDLTSRIDEKIKIDWKANNVFWEENRLLDDFSDFFNNIYLQLNGQREGTSAYDDNMDVDVSLDEDGNIYYELKEYSPYQKLLITNYLDHKKS